MKKYSFLPKVLLCATVLTSTFALATDRPLDNPNETTAPSLWQVVEEDYQNRYLDYRTKAIEYTQTLPIPQLVDGFIGTIQNPAGWGTAIENYKKIMHINPLPSEENWPVRGYAKQFNLHLITITEHHIKEQKDALLKEFLG